MWVQTLDHICIHGGDKLQCGLFGKLVLMVARLANTIWLMNEKGSGVKKSIGLDSKSITQL